VIRLQEWFDPKPVKFGKRRYVETVRSKNFPKLGEERKPSEVCFERILSHSLEIRSDKGNRRTYLYLPGNHSDINSSISKSIELEIYKHRG
jgi:hypothetical protein